MKKPMYEHSQISFLWLGFFAIAATATGITAIASGHWAAILAFVVVLTVLLLMPTLTIRVRDRFVICQFGAGAISRRIPIKDLREVRVVHDPWYYGWGIRLTPHGWLWRLAGSGSVGLLLANGKRFRMGSDEPEALAAALRSALAAA